MPRRTALYPARVPLAASAVVDSTGRILGTASLLNPDCGFATFADNPMAGPELSGAKLAVLAEAHHRLRERYASV